MQPRSDFSCERDKGAKSSVQGIESEVESKLRLSPFLPFHSVPVHSCPVPSEILRLSSAVLLLTSLIDQSAALIPFPSTPFRHPG